MGEIAVGIIEYSAGRPIKARKKASRCHLVYGAPSVTGRAVTVCPFPAPKISRPAPNPAPIAASKTEMNHKRARKANQYGGTYRLMGRARLLKDQPADNMGQPYGRLSICAFS